MLMFGNEVVGNSLVNCNNPEEHKDGAGSGYNTIASRMRCQLGVPGAKDDLTCDGHVTWDREPGLDFFDIFFRHGNLLSGFD